MCAIDFNIYFMNRKLTTDEFVKRSLVIHNSKYNYDLVDYIDMKTKIKIICQIHGEFLQTPDSHLRGSGCLKCRTESTRLGIEDFVKISKVVHNNKYDYSMVKYVNYDTKVNIICPTHGEFTQTPKSHIEGKGCLKCYRESRVKPIDIFINQSNIIHNHKYIYKNIVYRNNYTAVDIICPMHGEFNQTPSAHLSGSGCFRCNNSKGENKIGDILIKNNILFKPQYTFDNLKAKNKLRFDFGIIDENNNLQYLIEFNGIQHYEQHSIFHKNEFEFLEDKKRDELKANYCKKNNIPLYIIKYNEDIELYLKNNNLING